MSALLLLALIAIWFWWRETYSDPESVAFLALYAACIIGSDLVVAIRSRR